MQALPVALLLTAQLGLGLAMIPRFLGRERNRPTLIGLHLLFGIAALELIALLLRGTPAGDIAADRPTLTLAAGLIAAALLAGLAAAIIGKDMPRAARTMVWAHVAVGTAAIGAFIIWLSRTA